MKKGKIAILCAALVVLALTVTIVAATYDSSEDPLVSLSGLTLILDERITALETKIQTKLDEMSKKISSGTQTSVDTSAETTEETSAEPEAEAASPDAYEVVYVTRGEKIMADEACELILRAGECSAVTPFADQGLSDLTDASELLDGTALQKNHHLLIPRGNDGRGIAVTSESAYVMVKGVYTIVKP